MSNPIPTADLTPPEQPGPVTTESGSMLQFLLGALVFAAGISIAAAHAPARLRLLGLFSIGIGLLMGWLLTRLAAMLHVRLRVPQLILIGLATFAGLVAGVCQTVALQPEVPPAHPNPVAAILAEKMRAESGVVPGEAIPEFSPLPPAPPAFGDRVQRYLHRRVNTLGNWSTPWPELFWAFELLAGTASSIGMALWFRQEPRT